MASVEALTYPRTVVILGVFCRYEFGRCSSKIGRSTRWCDRLYNVFVTSLDVIMISMSLVYFLNIWTLKFFVCWTLFFHDSVCFPIFLFLWLKGYLRYKMITSESVSSEAQVKHFFYFVEKLCSVLKIFQFLYFQQFHDLPNFWRHGEY